MKFDFRLTALVIILTVSCNLASSEKTGSKKDLLVSCNEAEKVSGQHTTYLNISVGSYSRQNFLKVNMNGFNRARWIGNWGDASIEFRMFFTPEYDPYYRPRPWRIPRNEIAYVQLYCNATPNAVIGLNVVKNGRKDQTFHEYKIKKFANRQRFNLNIELDVEENDIVIKREQSSWEVLGRYNFVNMGEIYKVEVETRGPIEINEVCAREIVPGEPDLLKGHYNEQSVPKTNNPWGDNLFADEDHRWFLTHKGKVIQKLK